MSHPFTPQQLRLLAIADQVEDCETPAEKRSRHSRESRERRRQRIGDDAFKQHFRELEAARRARRQA